MFNKQIVEIISVQMDFSFLYSGEKRISIYGKRWHYRDSEQIDIEPHLEPTIESNSIFNQWKCIACCERANHKHKMDYGCLHGSVCERAFFALNVIVGSIKMALNKVREKKKFTFAKRNGTKKFTLHYMDIQLVLMFMDLIKFTTSSLLYHKIYHYQPIFVFGFAFFWVAAGTCTEWNN